MAADEKSTGLRGWVKSRQLSGYDALERWTHGGFSVLVETGRRFGQVRASEAAASLAFYSVFSIFPLLALMVVAVSLFVPHDQILSRLELFLAPAFPASVTFLSNSLQRLMRLRGAFGVAGAIGLIWSASNVFAILVNHINLAWEHARQRSYFQNRLFALGLTGAALGILAIFGVLAGLVGVLVQLPLPIFGGERIYDTIAWKALISLLPMALTFCVFLVIYRWVPNTRVPLREAAWAALAATGAWMIISLLFGAYLKLGFGPSNFLYGSIAALAILMLWIYLNSLILLFGAHLSSVLDRRQRIRRDLDMHEQAMHVAPDRAPPESRP